MMNFYSGMIVLATLLTNLTYIIISFASFSGLAIPIRPSIRRSTSLPICVILPSTIERQCLSSTIVRTITPHSSVSGQLTLMNFEFVTTYFATSFHEALRLFQRWFWTLGNACILTLARAIYFITIFPVKEFFSTMFASVYNFFVRICIITSGFIETFLGTVFLFFTLKLSSTFFTFPCTFTLYVFTFFETLVVTLKTAELCTSIRVMRINELFTTSLAYKLKRMFLAIISKTLVATKSLCAGWIIDGEYISTFLADSLSILFSVLSSAFRTAKFPYTIQMSRFSYCSTVDTRIYSWHNSLRCRSSEIIAWGTPLGERRVSTGHESVQAHADYITTPGFPPKV